MAESKKDWMKEKWRPAMGWMYMVVCVFDFVVFPILWSIAQALVNGGQVTSQWTPLTLQGAGLFHMAMGAVLGVAAWSRGQEKLAGQAGIPMQPSSQGYYSQPMYDNQNMPSRGYQPRTFVSSRGKMGPMIEEPEL